ncbi:MAG: hypothetical protein JW909_10735 [Planctomycetes bacterium]|nr:hypothetical protein [Planctomycetota bacterium]
MQKNVIIGVFALCLATGCTETALPGGQSWTTGHPMADAYVLADASYQEERANRQYSTMENEPVGTVAQDIAAANGVTYLGFASEEAAVTPMLVEVGPLNDLTVFNTTLSVLDMFLWKSAVSMSDKGLDIVPLPVNEVEIYKP